MKKVYKEIKQWIFENGVEIKPNDVVKIKFDIPEAEVTSSFLIDHPDNEVILRIIKINSRLIEGEVAGHPNCYLFLYPKNILDIEQCKNKSDLFPHRFYNEINEDFNIEI